MTDDEFIASFEDCSLPNRSFHHADHVRMAFLYLSRHSAIEALSRFSASLARFATAHGKPDLYNETVTWAFLLLIRERMARGRLCADVASVRSRQRRSHELEEQHPKAILPRRDARVRPRTNNLCAAG